LYISELSFIIIAIILLMLASIFFSLAETSILSLNKIRLKGYVERRRKNADIVKELLCIPENFLAAILIGNNVVNISISVLITVVVIDVFGPNAVSLATIIATILIVAFSEITPKAYAARNPEIAYKLAPIMKLLIVVLKPAIMFFTGLTNILLRLIGASSSIKEPIFMREDICHMIEMGEEEGVIHKKEKHLLKSALDFSKIKAGDIMIPLEKVTCIDAKATLEEAIELVRPALFAQPDTNLLELVELIKGKQTSMCFVVGDDGKPLGLITLGLILENIVGEIKNIE